MSDPVVERQTCSPAAPAARRVKLWLSSILRRTGNWFKGKQAAARLRGLRRSLRAAWLLDELGEGCQVIGYDWRYLYVNEAAARQGKRCPKEFIGRTVMEVYPGIEETDLFARLRECMKIRRMDTLEHEYEYRGGDTGWFEVRIEPVPSGLFLLSTDITARKQAEQQLSQARNRLQCLLENAFDVVAEIDAAGNIGSVSGNIEPLLGYQPDEVSGKAFLQFVRDEDTHDAEQVFQQALQGRPFVKCELTLMDRNGEAVVTESNVVPVFRDGTVEAVLCTSRNITKQREAEDGIRRAMANLRTTRDGIVLAMSDAVAARDPYTAAHQMNVVQLARAIATESGCTEDEIEAIRIAAALHDLGKLHIPGETLSKPGDLSDAEFQMIKEHSHAGFEILRNISFPWPIADIVLQHHERIDGSGYPSGLSGDDICMEARVLAVADVVEAMSSHRPYRPALGIQWALAHIEEEKGRLYDPQVVDTCLRLFSEKDFVFDRPV
ncbi:MAG: HD domain-containing phosphohydrolase [Chloroflexota bacterium]